MSSKLSVNIKQQAKIKLSAYCIKLIIEFCPVTCYYIVYIYLLMIWFGPIIGNHYRRVPHGF